MYKKKYVAPAMFVVIADLQHILAGSGGGSGSGIAGAGSDAPEGIDVPGVDGSGGGDGEDSAPIVESNGHTNSWSVWDD